MTEETKRTLKRSLIWGIIAGLLIGIMNFFKCFNTPIYLLKELGGTTEEAKEIYSMCLKNSFWSFVIIFVVIIGFFLLKDYIKKDIAKDKK